MNILFGGDIYPDDRFSIWLRDFPADETVIKIIKNHEIFLANLEAPFNIHVCTNYKRRT